jgi:hypothetical protein
MVGAQLRSRHCLVSVSEIDPISPDGLAQQRSRFCRAYRRNLGDDEMH